MSDYGEILLEDINHKFDAIMEGQVVIAHLSRKVDSIDTRLINVESDVKAIKAVLKDHSRDIAELKQAVI